jgi:starch phosphorylase
VSERFPHLPDRIAGIADLAYNLWWSWHPAARMLFKVLDRPAWKVSVHNPVRMLADLPAEAFTAALASPEFLARYDEVMAQFRNDVDGPPSWFAENVPAATGSIAYFSVEYGLHHSLPFYAGGLGFLAGDHLKECSDLGVPLVAVGFMYPEGYFRQKIRVDGWQEDVAESLDRDAAPITRVYRDGGEPFIVTVPFAEPVLQVGVWKVQVGRVTLYLMDTDIEQNDPWNRDVSSRLYIGDIERRIRQEIVYGIGGSAVLEALGLAPAVIHLNEGHTAFALLERVRRLMERGHGYDEAVVRVRGTSVFTTHTPVAAGHDVFPFQLMDTYFSDYYPRLGLSREAFMQLGVHPEHPGSGFNMTALALRMSDYHNGVSVRHGEVARKMWRPLFEASSDEEVNITSITNGVHVPTWIDPKMVLLMNEHLEEGWTCRCDAPGFGAAIDGIPDSELWRVHVWLKMKLLATIRYQARSRWMEDRARDVHVVAGGALLDPGALTIGFARRFATYKRADLIFSDMDRFKKLLTNRWRPLQIIFAGKAHPADNEGKRLLQRVFAAASDPDMQGRIGFVENYDEQLAQYLVHGVDVWLNNPVPPSEACGTSGMKAALNGVPHLSILDGWWIEGYTGGNGWAFDGGGAEAIYEHLERTIIPLYYSTDQGGVPRGWVKVMKEAIKVAGARFSARRMVKEYVGKFYEPALAAARARE